MEIGKATEQERLIREVINGVLRGRLETDPGERQERREEGLSSGVLVGKEAGTQGKARSNERIPS